MPGMAAKVVITERQQRTLQTIAFARGCPQGLAHRAEIIPLALDGLTNEEIAQKFRCERHGVGIWRKRWQRAFSRLTVVECVEEPPALREAIGRVLGDWPRAGCVGKFRAEQIAQILAVACEPPDQSGRPVTHWTPRKLADEAVKRGIATSISVRQVGRFSKGGGASAAQEPVLAQRRSQGRGRLRTAGARRL